MRTKCTCIQSKHGSEARKASKDQKLDSNVYLRKPLGQGQHAVHIQPVPAFGAHMAPARAVALAVPLWPLPCPSRLASRCRPLMWNLGAIPASQCCLPDCMHIDGGKDNDDICAISRCGGFACSCFAHARLLTDAIFSCGICEPFLDLDLFMFASIQAHAETTMIKKGAIQEWADCMP